MPSAVADVRAYYERNTRIFLRLGRNRHQAIHRAIWAHGVANHKEAISYINNLIAGTIAQCASQQLWERVRALDLGCGVGGTLLHLARHLPLPLQSLGVS